MLFLDFMDFLSILGIFVEFSVYWVFGCKGLYRGCCTVIIGDLIVFTMGDP